MKRKPIPLPTSLEGSIVLSSGRSISVRVTLWAPDDLTREDKRELRGFKIALHDLSPGKER